MAEFITDSEFGRFERQQTERHTETMTLLRRIEDQVRATNGRLQTAEQSIVDIRARLQNIEADDQRIERAVENMGQDAPTGWSKRKQAGVAAVLVAGGSALWATVQELIKVAHDFLHHIPGAS